MSNRLFFTVPLVLMGVLSGCNTTSLKEASTSFSSIITGKPTPEESIAYAKKTLYCSDTEFLPTNKSIQETEKRSQAELISEGKRVSVAYPTYFTNKNCELAAKSYSYCKGAEQESDCIKGAPLITHYFASISPKIHFSLKKYVWSLAFCPFATCFGRFRTQ